MKIFSLLITTHNRLEELQTTLIHLGKLLEDSRLETYICDDGSSDGTSSFIKTEYPQLHLIRNEEQRGLIYSRNRLLKLTTSKYAISLDDDAHFLTQNILKVAESYFTDTPNCGLMACRIFWGNEVPNSLKHQGKAMPVQGFVGCGHIWNMQAWREIPEYPAWFVFYGEEQFAAFQLFKKGWEVHYVPEILVQHRVEIKERKKDKDYYVRMRRALRSGWYLYLLFYPWNKIPKRLAYTLWMQLKLKVFRGDLKAGWAIVLALWDVIVNLPRILKNSNRLTSKEFEEFSNLPPTKIYWTPDQEKT
jgi:glycosyltransferase involved in cell wall biosynthesis